MTSTLCHSEERSDEESASRLRSKQIIRFGVARCWRAPAPLTRADHPIWSRALLARSCSSHQSRSSDLESRAAGALLLLSPDQRFVPNSLITMDYGLIAAGTGSSAYA